MTKIDVISGFLGAGKTTLIKKLLSEALNGTKVVLIENEFGEIGVDGGFLKDSGIEIKEMNSGCICCSLVGDFTTSLQEVLEKYSPERVLIEPSGVGKLSDVQRAVLKAAEAAGVEPGSSVAVVDASKCKIYMKNFGEFFIDQIEHAGTIILSRTQNMTEEKIKTVVELLREHNKDAKIVTTPWDELSGSYILETFEAVTSFEEELLEEFKHEHEHHHHDHDDDDDDECCCGHHHHDDDDDDDEHEHHHHHDHDHDHDHEHEHHHHDHGDSCSCGCHDHDHHHHHADEVFTSIGLETASKYTKADVEAFLEALEDDSKYGYVLRAKGMLASEGNKWIYFDYTPGEINVREGSPEYTGKICVIGSELKEDAIKALIIK
ncbi:MAG: GTP-binding protein [Lachnospiraceae bacterium]|nr:GTP-binding protein [Lachnospiraceae bacterium]